MPEKDLANLMRLAEDYHADHPYDPAGLSSIKKVQRMMDKRDQVAQLGEERSIPALETTLEVDPVEGYGQKPSEPNTYGGL